MSLPIDAEIPPWNLKRERAPSGHVTVVARLPVPPPAELEVRLSGKADAGGCVAQVHRWPAPETLTFETVRLRRLHPETAAEALRRLHEQLADVGSTPPAAVPTARRRRLRRPKIDPPPPDRH